ncbi:hypothetical protein NDR87_10225 [Nocardia sp. CDC159]|uniref:MmyB-like transcription regulator ligand binding domain-containing protein n=1 Tax=Nocardia pulmonis TaxID=2951408 RepID=A0A9X2IWR1_9NOCA|nr:MULTISPECIES: hypothetical protein [Nocardia]MCM6773844.1 hypothetical protein [Nocardia pulmonis]MCM6786731.1 hypothetical protein [Nocardia sp. CDC159]
MTHPTDTELLVAHPGPAATLTLDWDLVACNEEWAAVFTGLRTGDNLLEWLFTSPDARRLPEWRTTARHMLLWYVDGQLRNGGEGHALAALRPLATTSRAIRSLLADTDEAEVEVVFAEGAPVEVPDPETGDVRTYRFGPESLTRFDPATAREATIGYTMRGTMCGQ